MEAALTAGQHNGQDPDPQDIHGSDQQRLFPVSGTFLSLTKTGGLEVPDDVELQRGDVIELHVRAVVRHTGETDDVDSKTGQVVDARRVVKAAVLGHEILTEE